MTLFEHHTHPHQPRNVNALHKAEHAASSLNQRIAVGVTQAFSSMTMVWLIVLFELLWIIGNITLWRFDPPPFALLLVLINIPQIALMPLIMVGQRVLSRHQELQADEAYATTTKMYHDIEEIKAHLAAQDVALTKQTAFLSKR
jgi:uncharacterized membrane protein